MSKLIRNNQLFLSVKALIQEAQHYVVRNINTTMLITYFQIGKMIVEDEQKGRQRAAYAKETIKKLSLYLNKEFGKGYSEDNLQLMRKFYLTYQKYEPVVRFFNSDSTIFEPPVRKLKTSEFPFKLSWTHYIQLIRIDDENERNFYEIEAIQNNWSKRELIRQFNAAIYQRLALSRDKDGIKTLARKGQVIEKPTDALKSHYVLSFLI